MKSSKYLYLFKPIGFELGQKINDLSDEIKDTDRYYKTIKECANGYVIENYDSKLTHLLDIHKHKYDIININEINKITTNLFDKFLLTEKGYTILKSNKSYIEKYVIIPALTNSAVNQYKESYNLIEQYNKDFELHLNIDIQIEGLNINKYHVIKIKERIKERVIKLLMSQKLILHEVF